MLRDGRNVRAMVGAKRKRSMLVEVFLQPSRGHFIGGHREGKRLRFLGAGDVHSTMDEEVCFAFVWRWSLSCTTGCSLLAWKWLRMDW